MNQRQQSSTTHPIIFLMVLSSDHETGATGLTPAVTLSKDGGAFAAAAGAVSEVGNGWYSLAGNATDRNTLGELALHATAATADPTDVKYTIVPWDPFDGNLKLTGLTGLTAPTAGALATIGTGTGQIALSSGDVTFNNTSIGSVTGSVGSVTGNVGGNVVGSVGSVVATVAANLTQILGAALTGTAANLVGAFTKFFNVASPNLTTGGIDQTGDSFARIGATGSGLTSVAPAATALSNATWTNALATAINTLAGHDPGGTLASAASQTGILNAVGAITTNTARTGITVPQFVPLPASDTSSVRVKIKLFSLQGALEDADTNTVTIHASDHAGTSLDANLSSTTATRDSAGQYHVDYTVSSTDAEGGVYIAVTYTVGGVSMAADAVFAVAQADTVTSIASILSTVNTINSNVGTAGAGLTNLGDTRLASIYGKLPANNIADETLVINATNAILTALGTPQQAGSAVTLPAIPTGWITAAGIAAGALDGKGDWALAASAPSWYTTTVTVGGYAANEDPWTIWKNATPASNATAGTNEWRMLLADADLYTDETTDPTQWRTVYIVRGSGAPGTGVTLMTKKLFDTSGGKVAANTQVIGQASQ